MRRLNRCLNLTLGRSITRGRQHCDYLAAALVAYTRAIRVWRRLMKLAPHTYDAAVVHWAEQERLERLAWRKKWEPAIQKVYGGDRCPPEPQPWPERPENPRTRRVIEREQTKRALWMEIARKAMDDFKKFQPHAVPTLTQIARLLDVGITFGRLASGLETTQPRPEDHPSGYLDFEAALQKIYGTPLPDEPCEMDSGKEIVKKM